MNDNLVKSLRTTVMLYEAVGQEDLVTTQLLKQAADAIEELSKRIDRAVELYNRGVERSALYEQLVGIAPEPPKEEA